MNKSVRRILFAAVLVLGCDNQKTTADTKKPEPAVTPAVEPAPESLPEAEKVLAAAVEASGGEKAYDALKSYYSEARTDIPQQGLSVDSRTWWDGGRFFIDADMPGVGKNRVWYDGTTITSEDPINGRRVLEGKEANQQRWATSVSLPHDWKQFFATAETIGRREQDGRQLLDVKLTSKDKETIVLSFDEQTHLLASTRFEQQSPAGMLPIEVAVIEYKDFDGFKHATKTEMRLSIMTATTVITKFEPNVAIDPEKLLVPPPEPAKPATPPADKGKKPKKKGAAPKDAAATK
jgi:hypothetical protein